MDKYYCHDNTLTLKSSFVHEMLACCWIRNASFGPNHGSKSIHIEAKDLSHFAHIFPSQSAGRASCFNVRYGPARRASWQSVCAGLCKCHTVPNQPPISPLVNGSGLIDQLSWHWWMGYPIDQWCAIHQRTSFLHYVSLKSIQLSSWFVSCAGDWWIACKMWVIF
jgi:hypothetical protein